MNERFTSSNEKSETGPDPAADFARIAEESRKMVGDFLARQNREASFGQADPLNIASAFFEMTARMLANPTRLAEAQLSLWRDYMSLWQHATERMMGAETTPLATPKKDDRRFRDSEWDENLLFDFIKQSYLLTARWLQQTVSEVEGLDPKSQRKVEFYTRQFTDALSPSNFLLTNPEVLRATVESRGENLIRGLGNLLDDLKRGKGWLAPRMTDEDAFEVGVNIAITPGKVVFRNDLMELIQYAPATEKAYERPLLIIPPWINKFYILDLKPENSFVRWLVGRGYTVFVISWVNPDEKLKHKTFDDYMIEGPLAGLDAIAEVTGNKEATAIGYCLGGTLLSVTLAYLAAKKDTRIKAATFLASLVDFSEAGELMVFVDEEQVAALEKRMAEKGYLEGEAMAQSFNMLRANDLIWSFVVSNYLLGRDPLPFDLLYWNGDNTRMPAAMHGFYLRKMYLENRLIQPGGIEIDGVPIDLSLITAPAYVLSTKEDHIAPWKAAFQTLKFFKGPRRFVLSASGHVAGVINPPAAKKYGFWTSASKSKEPDQWLAEAKQTAGSWWPDWDRWNARRSGGKVPARRPGEGALKALDDAPGGYVKG